MKIDQRKIKNRLFHWRSQHMKKVNLQVFFSNETDFAPHLKIFVDLGFGADQLCLLLSTYLPPLISFS